MLNAVNLCGEMTRAAVDASNNSNLSSQDTSALFCGAQKCEEKSKKEREGSRINSGLEGVT